MKTLHSGARYGLQGILVTFFLQFQPALATPTAWSDCQSLLSRVQVAEQASDVLPLLDEFDRELWRGFYLLPLEKQNRLRASFDDLVDKALQEEMDGVRERAEELRRDLASADEPGDEAEPALPGWPMTVAEIVADQEYSTRHFYMPHVVFRESALADLLNLDPVLGQRFLRAIQRGIVPNKANSGVVRATDVHGDFVEVKVLGRSVARLLGCLRQGRLEIKRVYHKRNGGGSGSLQPYSYLCED